MSSTTIEARRTDVAMATTACVLVLRGQEAPRAAIIFIMASIWTAPLIA